MLRPAVARALERGALGGRAARALAGVWARVAEPVRPVVLPRGVQVIGVGGATLGGACKTPVVLSLARALSEQRQVAVVASSYSARPGAPRRVLPDDDVRAVGDEALWLARALTEAKVNVVVGRNRDAALALAARVADTVIVDGLLQARPERLAWSLLVLDGRAPWGAGRCPPAGDLRAPMARLLEACDVALVGPGASGEPWLGGGKVVRFESRVLGARTPSGERVRPEALALRRLGLVLAIARPERVLAELAAHGVRPELVELHADHARIPPAPPLELDAWLTTPKCATKLAAERGGVPVWVLEHEVVLPDEVVSGRRAPAAWRSAGSRP